MPSAELDPLGLINRQTPTDLAVVNYNGVLGKKIFGTLQFSRKTFGFRNAGGTSSAITDSPFRTRGLAPGVPASLLYNAPFFSANDPEDRNNKQLTGSLAYTLSNRRYGTHDLKGGAEVYVSTHTGGNAQSATNYVFQTDYLIANGAPALDSRLSPIPVFTPGVTRCKTGSPRQAPRPTSRPRRCRQDHWIPLPALTLTLGTRFEAVRGSATGTSSPSIRRRSFPASARATICGRTAARCCRRPMGTTPANTTKRSSGRIRSSAIRAASPGPMPALPDKEGLCAGSRPKNYTSFVSASFPTQNIFVAPGLSSPTARELTLSLGQELGTRSFVKVGYTPHVAQLRRGFHQPHERPDNADAQRRLDADGQTSSSGTPMAVTAASTKA
jgi:hypothetical protein